MKGYELKMIRKANRISALEIAKKLGYASKTPVLNAEKRLIVPKKFEKAILQILNLHFDQPVQYFNYIQECARILTTEEEFNSVGRSFPSTKWGKLATYGL